MKPRSAFATALLATLLLAIPVESQAFSGFSAVDSASASVAASVVGAGQAGGDRVIGEVPATTGIGPTTGIAPTIGTGMVAMVGRTTGAMATPIHSSA